MLVNRTWKINISSIGIIIPFNRTNLYFLTNTLMKYQIKYGIMVSRKSQLYSDFYKDLAKGCDILYED